MDGGAAQDRGPAYDKTSHKKRPASSLWLDLSELPKSLAQLL